LREARLASGFTQGEAAFRLGDRLQSFVSKCERGARQPTEADVDAFAALYGRPAAWFWAAYHEPGLVPDVIRVGAPPATRRLRHRKGESQPRVHTWCGVPRWVLTSTSQAPADPPGRARLSELIAADDVCAIRALSPVDSAVLEACDVWGRAPLFEAVADGKVGAARALLDAGASPIAPLRYLPLHGRRRRSDPVTAWEAALTLIDDRTAPKLVAVSGNQRGPGAVDEVVKLLWQMLACVQDLAVNLRPRWVRRALSIEWTDEGSSARALHAAVRAHHLSSRRACEHRRVQSVVTLETLRLGF
jgi:hypothetical protein